MLWQEYTGSDEKMFYTKYPVERLVIFDDGRSFTASVKVAHRIQHYADESACHLRTVQISHKERLGLNLDIRNCVRLQGATVCHGPPLTNRLDVRQHVCMEYQGIAMEYPESWGT